MQRILNIPICLISCVYTHLNESACGPYPNTTPDMLDTLYLYKSVGTDEHSNGISTQSSSMFCIDMGKYHIVALWKSTSFILIDVVSWSQWKKMYVILSLSNYQLPELHLSHNAGTCNKLEYHVMASISFLLPPCSCSKLHFKRSSTGNHRYFHVWWWFFVILVHQH